MRLDHCPNRNRYLRTTTLGPRDPSTLSRTEEAAAEPPQQALLLGWPLTNPFCEQAILRVAGVELKGLVNGRLRCRDSLLGKESSREHAQRSCSLALERANALGVGKSGSRIAQGDARSDKLDMRRCRALR